MAGEWLDVETAARCLGVKPEVIHRAIHEGRVIAEGRPPRVRRQGLEAALEPYRIRPGELAHLDPNAGRRPPPDLERPRTNRRLRVHGLDLATAQALSVLEGADHALTPNEISEHLHLTSGTLTTVIDSLEKRALVERQPHPEDRRKVLVSITDAGRAVPDRYLPEAVAIQTAMLGGLNDDEFRH